MVRPMEGGTIALLLGMIALGFRHGFDWDHIAAITDITSTTTASHADVDVPAGAPIVARGHDEHVTDHEHSHDDARAVHVLRESRFAHEQRHALGLATLYALGHASMVVVLGVVALLFAAILPEWLDPILEKVVGVTLLLLGAWVLFSVVQAIRGGTEFKLRSRWMLVFDLARYGWEALQARIHGHEHRPSPHATQYGPWTAFGVGVIHGIGAETGSQALLLAGIAGVTQNATLGIVILIAFTIGLLISNSLVAFVSATGFIGSQRLRQVYIALGLVVGVLSLYIGLLFLFGLGAGLPDLQQMIFGEGG
jgi:cytochrome c biogenesis protein CcdA